MTSSRHSSDDQDSGGEFLSIRERIVVAPHWGRVLTDLSEGQEVDRDTVLGRLKEQGKETLIVAPLQAVLIRWLVREGERVAPGCPVALLLSRDGNE
jgi:multidrug efflux pump subunit AcrA (membrane-fusion protein)